MLRPRTLALAVLLASCGHPKAHPEGTVVPEEPGHEVGTFASSVLSPSATPGPGKGPRPGTGSGGSGGSGGQDTGGTGGGDGGSGGTGGDGGTGGTGGQPMPEGAISFQDEEVALEPEAGDYLGEHLGMGGGVALVDLDGDGDLDLVLTSERRYLRAYRNDGNFHFTEFGPSIGLPYVPYSNAMALGDCDGDGLLELFVSRADIPQLYHRAAAGKWSLVTDSGLDQDVVMGLGSTFVDVDGDGDLDIVQTLYREHLGGDPVPPIIWLNDGSCRFLKATDPGLEAGMGVDVGVFDYDLDGDPDLLVVSDFGMYHGPTRLYQNVGGSFVTTTPTHGIQAELYGMGVGIGDLDGDGQIDAYVTQIGRNPFFHNLGAGAFHDDSRSMGIGNAWYIDANQDAEDIPYANPNSPSADVRAEARYLAAYATDRPANPHSFLTTGWTALIADLDGDSFQDLFITNGVVGAGFVPEGTSQHTIVYQGGPTGLHDVSQDAGLDIVGTHKGAALGDLDGDGLPDLVLFDDGLDEQNPRHKILRNESKAGHFLRIQLQGKAPNTWGIGARVEVSSGGKVQVQERTLHSGIYSTSADAMYVGLGKETVADSITVHWPWNSGITTVYGVPAGDVLISQPPDHLQ